MVLGRMEISWTYHMGNEEVLQAVKEKMNILTNNKEKEG
jgi:hypothetical protein